MKELWLFTDTFPYGIGEAFLENELPVLCRNFEHVRVFPMFAKGSARVMPSNAGSTVLFADPFASASMAQLLKHPAEVLSLLASLPYDAPDLKVLRTQLPYARSRMAQVVLRTAIMERDLMPQFDPRQVMVYSFWSKDWVTSLAMLHGRDPRFRYVSRMHGYDLYETRNERGWLPFRRYEMAAVDHVFCASQAGLDHMLQRYPKDADRFELARLGTRDHGAGPWSPGGPLRITSCSHAIPLKRIDLLIDALELVQRPVQWVHFGGGPELERLRMRAKSLPAHIRAELLGATANADILKHYATAPVDLAVHLSNSEGGVAVALQEAASFGIPLLATDAGGVRELVGPETGILLPLEVEASTVAEHLNSMPGSPLYTEAFRAGVRAFWSQHFNAELTYGRFCSRLHQLHSAWLAEAKS